MQSIRDLLTDLRGLGITHLMFDLAKDTRNVTALNADSPDTSASRRLRTHTSYILAHMTISGEPMNIDEVERRLGIVRGLPAPTERDRMMALLNWPAETLTLEQLYERTRGMS